MTLNIGKYMAMTRTLILGKNRQENGQRSCWRRPIEYLQDKTLRRYNSDTSRIFAVRGVGHFAMATSRGYVIGHYLGKLSETVSSESSSVASNRRRNKLPGDYHG